jgi:hypothetical protein
MIFEATQNEWKNNEGENGAYYDLKGLKMGRKYEVSCMVKSSPNATMSFLLWLHDTEGANSIKDPNQFDIPPSNEFQEYKRVFVATQTKAIRIHLHCLAGTGFLIVKEVKVRRIVK